MATATQADYAVTTAWTDLAATITGAVSTACVIQNLSDAPVQTCVALGKGHYEANPLFGKRPSCGKVVGIKIAGGIAHYVIADYLRDRDPELAKVAQIVTLVLQGGVVAANMRFVF